MVHMLFCLAGGSAQVSTHLAAAHTLMTFSRLDAFARGQIHGLRQAGKPRSVITKLVKKRDGTHPTMRAVDAVLRKKRDHPQWRGDDSRGGGRPRALTENQVKELIALVFAELWIETKGVAELWDIDSAAELSNIVTSQQDVLKYIENQWERA